MNFKRMLKYSPRIGTMWQISALRRDDTHYPTAGTMASSDRIHYNVMITPLPSGQLQIILPSFQIIPPLGDIIFPSAV